MESLTATVFFFPNRAAARLNDGSDRWIMYRADSGEPYRDFAWRVMEDVRLTWTVDEIISKFGALT